MDLSAIGAVLIAAGQEIVATVTDMWQQQLHAYDNRENAIQAMAFLTFQMPSAEVQEQIISDNFASSPGAKLAAGEKYRSSTLLVAGEQDRQDPLE